MEGSFMSNVTQFYCPSCYQALRHNPGAAVMFCPDSYRCDYEHQVCDQKHEHHELCECCRSKNHSEHQWPLTEIQMLKCKRERLLTQESDIKKQLADIDSKILELS